MEEPIHWHCEVEESLQQVERVFLREHRAESRIELWQRRIAECEVRRCLVQPLLDTEQERDARSWSNVVAFKIFLG